MPSSWSVPQWPFNDVTTQELLLSIVFSRPTPGSALALVWLALTFIPTEGSLTPAHACTHRVKNHRAQISGKMCYSTLGTAKMG